MPHAAPHHRFVLYCALNLGFLLLLGVCCAIGAPANPRLLYLVLLFALCSTAVIDLDGLNGRYSLLGVFLLVYFVSYGVGDLTNLMLGKSLGSVTSLLTATEAAVLAGGVMLVAGYRLAVSTLGSSLPRSPPKNWSRRMILVIGLVLWVAGTVATYRWYVYIVTDTTNEATRKGLNSLSTLSATLYVFGQMMQPLGILLLAYVYRVSRSPYALPCMLGVVLLQVALGFVIDIKGMAMLGGILVIVSTVLLENRLPKMWLAGAIAFAVFAFPIFQAYRTEVHGDRAIARTAVVQNLARTVGIALSAEKRVNTGHDRAQTFLERASLKGSVEMIVDRTGNGVEFQHGYTLTPILAAFVPKLLWPGKPDVPTGQLVNRAFHVSESDATYISPSYLGELYWNFGWSGVVLGMAVIGFACGVIGVRFNLAQAKTVTRLLITVVTMRQIILGFEGTMAAMFVVWLRSLAAIGMLHLVLAHEATAVRWTARDAGRHEPSHARDSAGRAFANLLSRSD